ncbi:MAG: tRNA uridine-5-carboxymethylaminomethyl(34) synthesis GTPase MnmE [Dethiobacter sp.]|jgi:tRNA modification GTPase|nr:tRNA uridine-5-carboxymethylaminomethyl(34) synthesis GTPase MnmE [Dethiobacter sp.]
MSESDTIAAISTPSGEGGIGIVRVSGPESFQLAKRIFVPHKGIKDNYPLSHHLYHGHIRNEQSEIVDEALVSFMRAPHTYTCEDTVEVNCHSGIFTLRLILALILKLGARLAEPGEFTKRAFLNGRIDLSQAESVLKIIRARSEEGVKIAARNVMGCLKVEVDNIRSEMLDVMAQIEALLEYPEDIDQEGSINLNIMTKINRVIQMLYQLLQGAERASAYQDGIDTAIIGKPNAGKSSLLNALLRQQRAIVHEIPGTTRDLLEGYLYIEGYPIRIMDTAGIRNTVDPVEQEGINRSKGAAERAKLILVVIDGSTSWSDEDEALLQMIRDDQASIIVLNKADLPQLVSDEFLANRFGDKKIIRTALVNNQGINQLEEEIIRLLDQHLGHGGENYAMIGLRHEEIVRETLKSMERSAVASQPLELVSLGLHEAWRKLGEITGEIATDELLDRIFSQFCLGK